MPKMNAHHREMPSLGAEMLEGAAAIAAFLGGRWNPRRVWHAGVIGSLPIRKKPGIGVYAFKSELVAALKDPQTRVDRKA